MTGIHLYRKTKNEVLTEQWKNGVLYLTFPILAAQNMFLHGFSTRIGGVSQGEWTSMNLSYCRGDRRENVDENYRRIADAIGCKPEQIVCSDQTHTANVKVVSKEDCGKGVVFPKDYTDVDGLVTADPGVILATFYADCVPLFLIDPIRRVAGLSHSGWRGTVENIAGETVRVMQQTFDCEPQNIIAAIGPSICQDCYEVSEDVIEQFRKVYPPEVADQLYYQKENGKFQLDLWSACRENLLQAGVRSSNIQVTDLCTCCNPDVLFSHRASKGRRGNLAAFLGIRESFL